MSSRILVFYAGMLYGEYQSTSDFWQDVNVSQEVKDGAYLYFTQSRRWITDMDGLIPEEDVPPQVRMLAMILT